MTTNSKKCCIREAKDLDHEEKVNKYQAMLAARLKAKYFSSKAFDKGTIPLHLAFSTDW